MKCRSLMTCLAFLWASVLLLPLVALSQTIEGPSTFPPHRLIRLTLSGLDDGDSAVWTAWPFDVADIEELANGQGAVLVAPPGVRVDVQATYLKDGKLGQARHTVTIEGTRPDIDPDPEPEPPPPAPPEPEPPIVEGRLHLSYIVDATRVTPSQAAIRTDPTIRESLATWDAAWRTYQSNEEDLDRLKLRPYAEKVGYPVLIVQDTTGKVIEASQVDEANDIFDAIARLRGGAR